jgi:uncharacterized RDD family membrane protein YckC
LLKPKFKPDVDPVVSVTNSPTLIDPDAYDASEQVFAASVEEKSVRRRFVVEQESDSLEEPELEAAADVLHQAASDLHRVLSSAEKVIQSRENVAQGTAIDLNAAVPETSFQAGLPRPQDPDSWRNEVAARVNHYRARRRPRTPRYPSLQLKFEPLDFSRSAQPGQNRSAGATPETLSREKQSLRAGTESAPDRMDVTEASARILEFPRSVATPPLLFDELADPIMDRPRILEAPELLPPPPALGGILIEPVEESAKERRPGFELPLQAAPTSRRLWAGAIDVLLVISGFVVFACIFLRLTTVMPPLQQSVGIAAALIAVFWIAYQYLLLVYTGTTPGLMLARLQLSRFDGSTVPRRIRRWRVLASALSGMSLAIGYAWCFLDEDRLCWHDRITHTYMAPRATPEKREKKSESP